MKIILLITLLCLINSCKDVIGLEENIDRELLIKKYSPTDSLNFLKLNSLDMGKFKLRTVNHDFVSIVNNSDLHDITIYNITSTNKSGLYSYSFPKGLPFVIKPKEDTFLTEKLDVKFIANAFNLDYYYDTLIVNNNPDFKINIKAKIFY